MSLRFSSLRFSALALVSAASIGVALGIVASTACLVAPPPDLPQSPLHRPTILHESVNPPPDEILPALPVEFVVPIVLEDANESYQWEVFVDYDPLTNPSPVRFPTTVTPTAGSFDGGVVPQSFNLDPTETSLDPSRCHRIEFLVAHGFNTSSPHTWDSIGGDLVSWVYNPGGGPAGCPVFDAGPLQDGAFPPGDSGSDGLPIVPESGTDP
jgi:hypothetical protein